MNLYKICLLLAELFWI